MHEAGSRVHGDEVRQEHRNVAVDPRVTTDDPLQRRAGQVVDDVVLGGRLEQAQELVHPLSRDDVALAGDFDDLVTLSRMHGDRQVGGQGPRRGRPDDREQRPVPEFRRQAGGERLDRELHVDRRGGLLLVFHLGLGQRRLAVHAPVDGLEPLVDRAPAHESPELARDHRLVGGRHGGVRVLPVPEHAQSLELLALDIDELGGVLAAAPDLLDRVHGLAHVHRGRVEAELLVHLVLDGQPVAIPAGDVDGVAAEHGARLHDDVLQDLVERRPHVDVAVGVGRTVVEDPERALGRRLADPAVDVHGLPALEHLRLELREVGLHRERGPRQVERALVVHREQTVTPAGIYGNRGAGAPWARARRRTGGASAEILRGRRYRTHHRRRWRAPPAVTRGPSPCSRGPAPPGSARAPSRRCCAGGSSPCPR